MGVGVGGVGGVGLRGWGGVGWVGWGWWVGGGLGWLGGGWGGGFGLPFSTVFLPLHTPPLRHYNDFQPDTYLGFDAHHVTNQRLLPEQLLGKTNYKGDTQHTDTHHFCTFSRLFLPTPYLPKRFPLVSARDTS
jgi:hypothetical protein